jgi:hypothetical protein
MRQVSIRLEQEAAIHLVLIHQAEAQAILRATIHQVKELGQQWVVAQVQGRLAAVAAEGADKIFLKQGLASESNRFQPLFWFELMKKTKLIMIWFLPLIVIGGLFYPILGYLLVAMMAFFLPLSFFKNRHWCWHLCPRGAFLDVVLSKVSPNRPVPRIFVTHWFRWLIFVLLMGLLIYRLLANGGSLLAIGAIFVGICILTTVLAIILGLITRHRGWCIICPMGTIQEYIGKMSPLTKRNKK